MNRICNTCNIVKDENNYWKYETACKNCYNKKRRKNKNQQPKTDKIINENDNNPLVSTYENNAYVLIGPRNVGKIYYMLKMLEKTGNKRPFHIITRSANQCPNMKQVMNLNQ